MARTISSPPPLPVEMVTVNLERLLSRLDKKLPPMASTEYARGEGGKPQIERGEVPGVVERRKIAANLEYARQLLLHLETEYATVKSSAQRKQLQEEMGRRKAVIRKLNERLHGVELLETMWEDEEEEREARVREKEEVLVEAGSKDPEPTSTLRNRLGTNLEPTATSTSASTSYPSSFIKPTTSATTTSTIQPSSGPVELEKQLSLHQRQQDEITADLLAMSRALKDSSLRFSQQLEEEKPYLELAAQGLDKNVLGMQQMGGRMDKLRKDGSVGWYRTIINVAIIVVLGLAGLIILMLPKLRR
ncbi:hypothetical protein BGX38DRAFT_1139358 [Terfezia claveryi]|nr:hypothetical protein BGX38DRAFT_1139358 [Terfezia claveryi]